MDINAVKTVLAKHFDRSSNQTDACSQWFGGEYWLPKHRDSLQFLLEEIIEDEETVLVLEDNVKNKILSAVNDLRDAADDIESAIENEL